MLDSARLASNFNRRPKPLLEPLVRSSVPVLSDGLRGQASWLLAGGADVKSVMERMGHSQIQTTQKHLHTLPDTDQRNLDALNRMRDRK